MDKNKKLPANRILGQTPQNTPQRACRVVASSGQYWCGASAYEICFAIALFQSVTYTVCVFFMSRFLKKRNWAVTGDFQQCGMYDQQRLRPACAYAQSDQSLYKSLEYSMTVKLLTEQHLEFLSLKGGCAGWSKSTLVKMPHCWKSHVTAQLSFRSPDTVEAKQKILSFCCLVYRLVSEVFGPYLSVFVTPDQRVFWFAYICFVCLCWSFTSESTIYAQNIC